MIGILAFFVVVLMGGVWSVDSLLNGNRIYQGVSVGDVDVSGMTIEEARQAINERYSSSIADHEGVIFTSEESAQSIDVDTALAEDAAQAEQLSLEQARANKQLWLAEAGVLDATVASLSLAEAAFGVGRDNEGLSERMSAAQEGRVIPVEVEFDEEALETLAASIDESTGNAREDYGIVIHDGEAVITEGHDGTAIDRDHLRQCLSDGFLSAETGRFKVVALPEAAPLRIGAEEAERARASLQMVLDRGCTVTFEETSWTLKGEDLGDWICTKPERTAEGWQLGFSLDETRASTDLLSLIRQAGYNSAASVSFHTDGDTVWVFADEGSRYPHASDAIRTLDTALFENPSDQNVPQATVTWADAPTKSTFDEALAFGLIGEISSFTTEYNDSPSTANRRHNIHLAADLLNNSVAQANGGSWSFNETVGEANADAGFQAAHAIINGEYDDAIGGGICQVATTVFNAVFEAGYPITERRNHSLYISSYPTGRDAAIAYPTLDLTWVNDTSSDVLMKARYSDSTLTIALYGISPGYVVTSQTGDWEVGEAFKKTTKVDENEPAGSSYVKTVGADGRKVSVHRIVRDRLGTVVREDDFASNYAPIDEVTIVGPELQENTKSETVEDENVDNDSEQEQEEDSVLPTGD